MPRYAKRSTRRKTTIKRRPRVRRSVRSTRSRTSRTINTNPNFLTRFNYMRKHTFRVTKTDYFANTIGGAGGAVSECGYFDPSGVNSTHGAMPEWASYAGLYKFYKVNKIRLTFTLMNLELTDNAYMPEVFVRYQYDQNQGNPSASDLEKQKNWLRATFGTSTQRTFSYTIYPKVQRLSWFDTVTELAANQAFSPAKMQWTSVVNTAQCYGYMFYIPNLPTGISIRYDIGYDVSFKDPQ